MAISSRRKCAAIPIHGGDLLSQLPAELFHMVVNLIPEPKVNTLRLVCKAWKERLDVRDWPNRVLILDNAGAGVQELKKHARKRMPRWKKSLEYIHLRPSAASLADSKAFDGQCRAIFKNCTRVHTVILQDCSMSTAVFLYLCNHCSDMRIERLVIDSMSWTQLELFMPHLRKMEFLHTLELDLQIASCEEMRSAFDWEGWESWATKGVPDQPRGPDPDLSLLLRNLKILHINFQSRPGMRIFGPQDDEAAENRMLDNLHTPLIRESSRYRLKSAIITNMKQVSVLLSAENLVELKLTNSGVSQSGTPSDCRRQIEEDIDLYSSVIDAMGECETMKTAIFKDMQIDYRSFKFVKEVTLINCDMYGVPRFTESDYGHLDHALEKLTIQREPLLSISGQWTEESALDDHDASNRYNMHHRVLGYSRHTTEVLLAPNLRELNIADDSGFTTLAFLESLRKLTEPILSLKNLSIQAREKLRSDEQFFSRADFDRLIWANLRYVSIIDGRFIGVHHLATIRLLLRAKLRSLVYLEIEELEESLAPTNVCMTCGHDLKDGLPPRINWQEEETEDCVMLED